MKRKRTYRVQQYPVSEQDWAVYVTAQMGGVVYDYEHYRWMIADRDVTASMRRLQSKGWLRVFIDGIRFTT
jgi:hypothetical protein